MSEDRTFKLHDKLGDESDDKFVRSDMGGVDDLVWHLVNELPEADFHAITGITVHYRAGSHEGTTGEDDIIYRITEKG